jgi:hypothetical protein
MQVRPMVQGFLHSSAQPAEAFARQIDGRVVGPLSAGSQSADSRVSNAIANLNTRPAEQPERQPAN